MEIFVTIGSGVLGRWRGRILDLSIGDLRRWPISLWHYRANVWCGFHPPCGAARTVSAPSDERRNCPDGHVMMMVTCFIALFIWHLRHSSTIRGSLAYSTTARLWHDFYPFSVRINSVLFGGVGKACSCCSGCGFSTDPVKVSESAQPLVSSRLVLLAYVSCYL